MSFQVGDLIPIVDEGVRDKIEQEIEPSIRYETTTDDGSNNYALDTSGTYQFIDGQPVLAMFGTANTGASTMTIDSTTVKAIVRDTSLTAVQPGDLNGLITLVYMATPDVYLALPVLDFVLKDEINSTMNSVSSAAQFLEITAIFPSGQTTHTVNNSFIEENNCKLTIAPQDTKDGDWSVEYINGSVTITSDVAESADVPYRIHIIK